MTKRNDPGLLPVEEAARTLGITPLAVLMLVKRGHLEGKHIDESWYVTTESLGRYREEGRRPAVQSTICRDCSSGCSS